MRWMNTISKVLSKKVSITVFVVLLFLLFILFFRLIYKTHIVRIVVSPIKGQKGVAYAD